MSVEESSADDPSRISSTGPKTYSSLVLCAPTLSTLNGLSRTDGLNLLKDNHAVLAMAVRITHYQRPDNSSVKKVLDAFEVFDSIGEVSDANDFPQISADVFSELHDVTQEVNAALGHYKEGNDDATHAAWRAGHDWASKQLETGKGDAKAIEDTLRRGEVAPNEGVVLKLALYPDPPSDYKELLSNFEGGRETAESCIQGWLALQERIQDFIKTSDGAGTPSYHAKWVIEDTRSKTRFQDWYESAKTGDAVEGGHTTAERA